ncbi:MAG: hypothetical protein R3E08_04310 [Thiotrichaceae bacterium]
MQICLRRRSDAWLEAAQRLGTSFGEFVPISPLIAEMVTEKTSGTPLQNIIRKVRLKRRSNIWMLFYCMKFMGNHPVILIFIGHGFNYYRCIYFL